jgi:hypothetical protein
MKGKTKKSEMMEAPKSRKMPKDKMSKGVMVAGAMRPKKMYDGGETMGTKGTARGMGAAVKGGKFRDL